MFVVLRVYQDYDYVEGVELAGKFDTEREATSFIEGLQVEEEESNLEISKCINEYFDSLGFDPNPTVEEWNAFKSKLGEFGNSVGLCPEHFEENLKRYLWTYLNNARVPNFNPPPSKRGLSYNLFIVEIP